MKTSNALFTILLYNHPDKFLIIRASLYSAINKICDILPEILISIALDVIINQERSFIADWGIMNPFHQLYIVGLLTVFFWILESIFEYLYSVAWNLLAQQTQHNLRLQVYKKLQQCDLGFFEHKTTGELLSIIQDDIFQLEFFISKTPNELIQLIVNIVLMGVLFFYVSPFLAFLTLIPIPFVIGITYYFQHKLAYLYSISRQTWAELTAHINYRLLGINTIKSYTSEQHELELLKTKSRLYQDANHQVNQLNALYIPTLRIAIMIGFVMSLVVGGVYTIKGFIAINWYATLVFLTQRFLWPFTTLTSIADVYEKASASAKRIVPILSYRCSIQDGDQKLDKPIAGNIDFNDVSFSYSNGRCIFNKISFKIPAKTTVAFIGHTGAGKSTVINLLLRYYDINSGNILIDGHNIKDLKLTDLRKSIAVVSQDIYLVEGTIADNIAYGVFTCSQADVVNAAKLAQIHGFIMELPQGYETKVCEQGKNLSGGQKQRLSIARAILKNSPILVFDEATSALDNETQAAIQESIALLKATHTIIIIAHHLSTVSEADIIFVLDNGVIVESGNHEELLKKNGYYAHLCSL